MSLRNSEMLKQLVNIDIAVLTLFSVIFRKRLAIPESSVLSQTTPEYLQNGIHFPLWLHVLMSWLYRCQGPTAGEERDGDCLQSRGTKTQARDEIVAQNWGEHNEIIGWQMTSANSDGKYMYSSITSYRCQQ
jgi:hypothetical protein